MSNSEMDVSFIPDDRVKLLLVSMLKKAKTLSETAPALKKLGEEVPSTPDHSSTACQVQERRKSLPPFGRLWATVKTPHSPVTLEETPDLPTHLAVLGLCYSILHLESGKRSKF